MTGGWTPDWVRRWARRILADELARARAALAVARADARDLLAELDRVRGLAQTEVLPPVPPPVARARANLAATRATTDPPPPVPARADPRVWPEPTMVDRPELSVDRGRMRS